MRRRDVLVISAIVIGALAAVVALVQWEMSRECVRWSTRFDATRSGGVKPTQICAEFRPRGQYGDEPPFDPRGPKTR